MWNRHELKEKAKAAFKANYWICVVAAIIMGIALATAAGSRVNINSGDAEQASQAVQNIPRIIIGAIASVVAIAGVAGVGLKIFLLNPLAVGGYRFFYLNSYEPANLKEFGWAFKGDYLNVVKVMFFRDLYTFLWSLLFVVPGIVKSYEYKMIPYLLAEDHSMNMDDAFAKTKEMMTGNKSGAFVLDLSFIGWHILSAFTAGILEVFYVAPYVRCTEAELYRTLKEAAPRYNEQV